MSSGLPAWVTSQAQLAVENMFLRKEQALYHERFVKPRGRIRKREWFLFCSHACWSGARS
jgi:hypothetical protein